MNRRCIIGLVAHSVWAWPSDLCHVERQIIQTTALFILEIIKLMF